MVFRTVRVILFLFLIASVAGTLAWGQSTSTGTVAGIVTDSSGAVVAGATVTLTDAATHTPRTTTTNDAGRYIFVDVNPGVYSVDISKHGFATTKISNEEVNVGAALTLNASLQVGGTNVVVEVQATGTELQTMNATVGNTVTAAAIDNLPSIGRDVNTFIELQPGVGTDGDVAGAVTDQSTFTLDGGNNTNDMDGNGSVYLGTQIALIVGDPTGGVANANGQGWGVPAGVMPTPQDSVEEVKVNTTGQTADFNSSAGAEIKVVTKRGTSAFHGTVYEYYRDNNWSPNTWQNNWLNYIPGDHVDLPSYHYSRFGGALGGPISSKDFLGGKTFFFANYEGFRYPSAETIFRNVPSPALQLGLLSDSKAPGQIDYNLNNAPVTYNGTTYPANYGCTGLCDPQGLGLNPLVSQIWSKYEPASNAGCSQALCDGSNILGYSSDLNLPTSSNFGVVRLDHDFSSKQHLMGSYRYYNLKLASDSQVDIGGFFPGDTKGTPASAASDPVEDWYLVLGLTSNITNNTTNDLHYSFLRNWWAWNRNGAPPQVSGLGGALEIMSGQNATQDLGPFNVNNQQIRRRFWDGHDQMLRDDISMLHGNHLFQFGGYYQHNFDYHQRNDSGGSINAFPVYSLGNGTTPLISTTGFQPCGTTNSLGTATNIANCASVAAAVLGATSIASQLFTRTGANLALNPPLSNAFDKSTIPYYNFYFSDTWHMKPSFTLTYGLGWALEMPPTEQNGKQTVIVDQADEPVTAAAYIKNRETAALQGQVYNPELGFALVGNAAGGNKYPYNPFYGEFSPRVAIAWNPKFDPDSVGGKLFGHDSTVIRGGYGRVYGRTNGVDQVLVPLLGLGLEQPIGCNSNIAGAGGAWNCATSSGTFSNVFRVEPTASNAGGPTIPLSSLATPTLPQPVYPGYNNPASASPEGLDPNYRPNAIDSFDLTLQRQLNRRLTMEVGYIGRRITHEFLPIWLNAVPYMMNQGGQNFASAYANLVTQLCGGITGLAGGGCGGSALPTPGAGPNLGAVQPQPFFETALARTGYCTNPVTVGSSTITPANCTQAVALNEGIAPFPFGNLTNAQVWGLWNDLDSGVGCPVTGCTVVNGNVGAFNFPRSLQNTPIPSSPYGSAGQYTSGVITNTSLGHGNYNALFWSLRMADWKGLTLQSNFTWSKALGTASQAQSASENTVLTPFNLNQMYGVQPFDRRLIFNAFFVYQPPFFQGQNGFLGRVLGGWTFSSIFTAGTGIPIQTVTTFGDYQAYGGCDGVGCADYDSENAVPIGPQDLHTSNHYCKAASVGPGGNYYAACAGQAAGGGYPVNAFSNGANDYVNWRNPILGIDDSRDEGYGSLTGLSYWNMDFSIKKNIRVAERVGVEVQGIFANLLNHDEWGDGYPGLYNPAQWGAQGGQVASNPRAIEVGARVRF
jgi:Carboxypeptidase regulatory-like domain